MERRKFIRNVSLGTAAAGMVGVGTNQTVQAASTKADATFNLDYAPHFGMFKNLAGDDLLDQITYMHERGFRSLEDNGMMKRTPAMQEKIGNHLAKLGMTMGVFVLDKGGNGANTLAAGKQEHVDVFLDGCKKAVEVAKRVNAKWTTVVPGNFQRNLPLDIQNANVIEALRKGAEILEPHGLTMVLEPLSDNPDLYLRYSPQTYLVCKGVNSPSCKILYDIYHQQKNEGHLITLMEMCWDEIAYIQIGDNPGRKEPGTGEINFQNVFKYIYEKGYKGVCGMEHGNFGSGEEGEEAVIQAYRKADSFL
ncbi:MAG: TIM barrel protein [Cytophagales bacterium]|uniref:hydroxypyruvate isomerase family protein n=1 Tax=Cyclobacterium marinum TaxID=104 RepID=UPI0030D92070|nr:TIM barrel protein [Cytophagales bacterium]|tara:strand:+ start:28338 stop:29258 length:921 start_codon:yes stop_codon:yes gene_type:complete